MVFRKNPENWQHRCFAEVGLGHMIGPVGNSRCEENFVGVCDQNKKAKSKPTLQVKPTLILIFIIRIAFYPNRHASIGTNLLCFPFFYSKLPHKWCFVKTRKIGNIDASRRWAWGI